MAIDTAVKRKSLAAVPLPHMGPVIVPSGGLDQADRQAVGYGYAGILASGGGPPAVVIPVVVHHLRQQGIS